MPTVSIHLPQHLADFTEATGNRSGYITRLLEDRQGAYIQAHARIKDKYPHPAIMAVMDVLNGHFFTDGFDPAEEIRASLEDSEELRNKWGLSDDTWSHLMSMGTTDASAFRTLASEFWAGREM